MTEATVFNTPLVDQPEEYWINTIFYRLAIAMGYKPDAEGLLDVDADEILDEAVNIIEAYR